MGTARRIYRNAIYLGVAEIVSKILLFVVMLYAARLLSKEHFGKFSFALSLSLIAIVLADLGINTLLVREISRNKCLASRYFVNAFVIKIALSFITFFAVVWTLNLLNYPNDTKQIVYAVWLFTIISTFTELFYSIFRAFEMMQYDAFLKILRMVLLTISSLYILSNGYGILLFSYSFVFTEIFVVLIALAVALKNFIKLELIFDFSFAKRLLKKSLPFGLAIVFGSIYFYIGSVMLSKLRGDAEVAVYSVAYNIALAILFVPTVYTNAIYPVLSRYFKQSKEGLKTLYERSFKYLYIIGLPISAGLYVFAERLIIFFYGSVYSESVIALQIISFYLVIKFINFLLGAMLSSIDRQNDRMLGQGVTAGFNVLLNLFLIPEYGYIGAAWATLVTEVFLFGIYYFNLSKNLYYYNFLSVLLKPFIAVLAMLLSIKFFDFSSYRIYGLFGTVIICSFIYGLLLWFLRTLDGKDYQIIRSIFKNEKLPENA